MMMGVREIGLLFIFYYTLPDSAIVDIGLSGNKIPLSINSSRLARTDIFRSRAKNLFVFSRFYGYDE